MNLFLNNMTKFWRITLLVLMAPLFLDVNAATKPDVQSLESITSAVEAAAINAAKNRGYEQANIHIQSLDQRLALPICEQPLNTFLPANTDIPGSLSVGVKCSGVQPWTIYVRANLQVSENIPVLISPLPRQSIIGESDLQWIAVDLSSQSNLNNLVTDPSQLVGMETTRPVQGNMPIRLSDIRSPKIIKRGQQVTLVYSSNNLEVRVKGKSLGDAAFGDRVLVQNLSSGNKVEGIANKDSSVQVK